MMLFLMVLATSLLGLAVISLMFHAVTPPEERTEAQPEARIAMEPSKFFNSEAVKPAADVQIPVEVLLSQIERHVRLEQAAAETFLAAPRAETLRTPTSSPLVH